MLNFTTIRENAMNKIAVTIVGNGGCFNNGLPYNAFMLNNDFLVEAPPDIMYSLQTLHLSLSSISTLFISHLHADHCFGLPFLVINKWLHSIEHQADEQLHIYGPPGIDTHLFQLIELAFSKQHPCYAWAQTQLTIEIISQNFTTGYEGLNLSFFELEHIRYTYGLELRKNSMPAFAYIADTRWCNNITRLLATKPPVVLLDMNGGKNGVHLSREEVIEKGLPVTGTHTTYYGTHLFHTFESETPYIICASPGMKIKIPC
jgi:hypothetical protein